MWFPMAMPAYPTTGDERLVPFEDLRRTVAAVFSACGMSPEDAALLAETLAAADLSGVHSHGVLRVPEYVEKLRDGGVDPRGRPQTVRSKGAAEVVDGGNAMGQIACTFAMKRAVALAREHAIGAVAVSRSNHCGAMAYFALEAAENDMIGTAYTNASPNMDPLWPLKAGPLKQQVVALLNPVDALVIDRSDTLRPQLTVQQRRDPALAIGRALRHQRLDT